jgi:hypothetical protein
MKIGYTYTIMKKINIKNPCHENWDEMQDNKEGFYEKATTVNGSAVQSFTQVSGPPCMDYVDLPAAATGITGFGHTHTDYNCKGRQNILAPSADDVMVFLYKMVKQASNVYGDYSNAYYFTVTSGGSYLFQYTGSIHPQNLSFNIIALRKEYDDLFKALKNKDSDMPQDKVEKTFAKFLKEKVNIEGLELYKVTADSAEKLEYDPTTKAMTTTPCP